MHQTSHHTFKYIKSLIVMEQNWFNLIRHNCSSLLSQVMASQSSSSLSTTNKKMGNNIDGRNGVSSRFESNANDMAHPSDSIINQSLYLSSSDVMASSRPNEQMLVDMKQMLQTNADVSGTDLFIDENYTQLLEPSPHLQDHIMQEHSESARNALIYIAVILGIYLIAVASIVIQYYHKYSTLDPLTAFILRRSTNESKDRSRQKNRRRRRHSSSNGFESLRSPQLVCIICLVL